MIAPADHTEEDTTAKEAQYLRVFDGDLDPEARSARPPPPHALRSRQPSFLGDPAPDVTTLLLEAAKRKVASSCDALYSQPDNVIVLAHDLYSIALVEGIPVLASIVLPLLAAICQSLVLYMLAFTDENLFDEGRWLEPVSPFSTVNAMKIVSTMVVVFKISSEMQQAQQLCRALFVGDFQVPQKRLCGWWAVSLQYAMALFVSFVSLSTVLSSPSCVACIIKIFTVFVVVDMDNLAARFLEGFVDLDFEVKTSQERLAAESYRENQAGGTKMLHLCCMVVPVIGVVVLAFFSIVQGQLPLTIVKHGYVSNRAAPRFMQTNEGCCPPVEESRSGTSVSYNVFLLSSIRQPPPIVHWVALHTDPEPRPPSSLQVQEGFDGDGNYGALSGSQVAEEVQAHYWLQVHGLPASSYATLQRERLYHSFMPFNVSIKVNDLTEPRYRFYFAAQNPATFALSSFPVRSEVFSTSMCAHHCASCNLSGPGFCDRCNEGAFRTSSGKCVPCASHCYSCNVNSSSDSYGVEASRFFTSGDCLRHCDPGECHPGYTRNKEGFCDKCEVEHCDSCDAESLDVCSRCLTGFGVAAENGTCSPCAHKHCSCDQAGGCDSCATGWGLTESNATCVECDIGCGECMFAHAASCSACSPGFVMTSIASDDPDSSGTECMRCAQHCANCSRSGAGSCDECKTGLGYNADDRECQSCSVPHCESCAAPREKCSNCEQGFGLTSEGACERCGLFCELCDQAAKCASCSAGYALRDGSCWSCADMCASCEISGPAKCDRCLPGFHLDPTSRNCLPPSLRSAPTLEV